MQAPALTRTMKPGMAGADVYVMKRAVRRWASITNHPRRIESPVRTNVYGKSLEQAVSDFHTAHAIKREPHMIGVVTYSQLLPFIDERGKVLLQAYAKAHAPATKSPPLAYLGPEIGFPYIGTHADFGNWESDNAIDIGVRYGTPVLAVREGTLGPQIGPLDTGGDPALLGQRLHLVTADQEFYYAHLSVINVQAGQHVEAGQRLGLSGSANGVEHLHFATMHGDPGIYINRPTPRYQDRHYPG